MTECPDPVEWLLVAADEAPPERRRALEAHLAECGACRRELASVSRGLAAMHAMDRAGAVRPEVLDRLRGRLSAEAARQAARPRLLVFFRRHRWAAAAAAVLLAVGLTSAVFLSGPPAAPSHSWRDDLQVTNELAEITAGLEMLELSDRVVAYENGTNHKTAPEDPKDEIDRFLEDLAAEMGLAG